MLGKIYLFLTPSKTDGRVPSQQDAPTTCNLSFSADMSRHYWQISALQWRGVGGGLLRRSTYQNRIEYTKSLFDTVKSIRSIKKFLE